MLRIKRSVQAAFNTEYVPYPNLQIPSLTVLDDTGQAISLHKRKQRGKMFQAKAATKFPQCNLQRPMHRILWRRSSEKTLLQLPCHLSFAQLPITMLLYRMTTRAARLSTLTLSPWTTRARTKSESRVYMYNRGAINTYPHAVHRNAFCALFNYIPCAGHPITLRVPSDCAWDLRRF